MGDSAEPPCANPPSPGSRAAALQPRLPIWSSETSEQAPHASVHKSQPGRPAGISTLPGASPGKEHGLPRSTGGQGSLPRARAPTAGHPWPTGCGPAGSPRHERSTLQCQGSLLISKSLKQQLSVCGPHPCGRPQGQGECHHCRQMLWASSRFLPKRVVLQRQHATPQRTEGKRPR